MQAETTMFNALKKAFRHEPSSTPSQHPHSIQGQSKVSAILIQIYRAHVLLNVSFPPDNAAQFTSALLGIYDEHGFIVLDEITPKVGHKWLLEKKQAHVAGRLNGADFHFTSHLIDVREKGGVAFYKMEMPDRIIYRQRRQDFRITTLGRKLNFHSLRGTGNHQILRGYIHDVSRSGLKVILNDDLALEPGEILPSCVLTLPQCEIVCSLEVRFCSHDKNHDTTRVGCRFKQIGSDNRRKIQLLITKLERDKARRLRGN
jgi:c-di-GMP-binding flagellar brake protein YcgR